MRTISLKVEAKRTSRQWKIRPAEPSLRSWALWSLSRRSANLWSRSGSIGVRLMTRWYECPAAMLRSETILLRRLVDSRFMFRNRRYLLASLRPGGGCLYFIYFHTCTTISTHTVLLCHLCGNSRHLLSFSSSNFSLHSKLFFTFYFHFNRQLLTVSKFPANVICCRSLGWEHSLLFPDHYPRQSTTHTHNIRLATCTMDNISDHQIQERLVQLNFPMVPVTNTTRKLLINKLQQLDPNMNNVVDDEIQNMAGDDEIGNLKPVVSSSSEILSSDKVSIFLFVSKVSLIFVNVSSRRWHFLRRR